ncbi:2OG-Fe(II)oxygenase superfamily protein [Diaporthe helianthi]|uniref:2OG-Fe(II)oxygenase superfamily protein n=1 Tax=Diaporthe helianthi TaxID=158607 RepID=A0A2P5I7U4_DIAHE|nr:2OG-Fe(II)oxygenase superfamily protein [Diaporthe helianthi]
MVSQKRTIDSFFTPPAKQQKVEAKTEPNTHEVSGVVSTHPTYPFPIPGLPTHIEKELSLLPATQGRVINDQLDLDLLYFQPYVPGYLAKETFNFLRSELPFYRVKYTIKRGPIETQVNTPRYTTVFGIDNTSRFTEEGIVVDAKTGADTPGNLYQNCSPRPIPKCLDDLRRSAEAATGYQFNFCLVNYYSSGSDSISYHSDDERFLGPDPAIASFSFGARRDFLLKHKPLAPSDRKASGSEPKSLKLPLESGDMILMRGRTQSCWLHSIPKRTGKNVKDGGRINITFRKALVKGGTSNYYNYNVGTGPVYKWDKVAQEMRMWIS